MDHCSTPPANVVIVAVLLGGDAGLRLGEIAVLKWTGIDQVTGRICVQRSGNEGRFARLKNGNNRSVPMTERLANALAEHRHLNEWVLHNPDGTSFTRMQIKPLVARAARRAGAMRLLVNGAT